jgi:hypothetical protein
VNDFPLINKNKGVALHVSSKGMEGHWFMAGESSVNE